MSRRCRCRTSWFAIYPFLEPLLVQGLLVLAVLIGAAYAFATRPDPKLGAPAPAPS